MAVIRTVNFVWDRVQDCRKSLCQTLIIGHAWILHTQIIMGQLHAYSDSMAAGPEGDVENEERITKINTHLQGRFGAQYMFEGTNSSIWRTNACVSGGILGPAYF